MAPSSAHDNLRERTVGGHPLGLLVLSGTQLWERLSFYGIQVIVAYYIYYEAVNGGLGLPQNIALGIVGSYGAGVYLAEPIGAWLADRIVASRYVIIGGLALIMTGHLSIATTSGIAGLILGLSFIILGTGLLFPNVRTLVAGLYENKPLKQDAGFALFYAAIMVGALIGPLITGFLQTRFGFHVAFSAAAFGMAIGLLIYLAGWKKLPESASRVPNPLHSASKRKYVIAIVLFGFFLALITRYFVTLEILPRILLVVTIAVSIAYFIIMVSSDKTSSSERRRVFAYIPVFVSGVVFWTLVLQLFTTFAVYADLRVDMRIWSFEVPPAYISSFEVIAGIVFSFLLAALWQKLGKKQPSTPAKMAVGLVLMALAYGFFGILPFFYDGQISLWPVILGMIIFGAAEIIYAPLLYSITTQAAPQAFRTQMMALQGLSMAVGASLSGYVGNWFTATASESVFFGISALITLLTALLLFGCAPLFRRVGITLMEPVKP